MVSSPNCAKIKSVASSWNSVQEEMLLKSCQEFQSIKSSRAFLEKIQNDFLEAKIIKEITRCQSGQEGPRSKFPRDPNCQDVKIANSPRYQVSKGSPKRSKVSSYHEIQMSKSFPKKCTLSEAELFLVISFPCFVKGPLLEPMDLVL